MIGHCMHSALNVLHCFCNGMDYGKNVGQELFVVLVAKHLCNVFFGHSGGCFWSKFSL